jgi:hypothetical protein
LRDTLTSPVTFAPVKREISQNETLLRLIEVEILQNLLAHTTFGPLDDGAVRFSLERR